MRLECPPELRPELTRASYVNDAIVAVSVFGVLLCAGSFVEHAEGLTALGVAVAAAATLPLVWRRRFPYLVLVLTAAGVLPAMEVLTPTAAAAIAPMIALYTVASLMPVRMACFAAVKLGLLSILATVLFWQHSLWQADMLKNIAMVSIPAAIGASVRERRMALEALRQRAERAEATREEEARRRVGEERLRIAREVHDVVAHALVAINVQAGVAAHLSERRPEAGHEALGEIKRVSGEALTDLRATLGVLREPDAPAPTRPAPTLEAIEDLAGPVRAAGVDVRVDVHEGDGCTVPLAVASAGYRIVQEALTNVLRHARDARRVDVRVATADRTLRIEVVDDGDGDGGGGEPGTAGSRNGVRGMRERAAAVGGELVAGRHEGGWRVLARLPLPVAEAPA